MKHLIQILLLAFSLNTFAQSNYYLIDTAGIDFEVLSENDQYLLDSLLPLANEAKHDTTLLRHLDYLVENCWDENLWPRYNTLIISITDKHLDKGSDSIYISYKANAINNVGYYYNSKGKTILALENYKAALALFEKIGQLEGQSSPLNNIGYTYKYLGDIDKALEYYHRSLSIREKIGDESKTSVVINNLASLYEEQGDDSTAREYYLKTLRIGTKYNDKRAMGLAYSNLGNLFFENDQIDSALNYYEKSFGLRKEIGFKRGMAQSLINIGKVLERKNKQNRALEYYLKARDIIAEQNLLSETINVYTHLGTLYLKLGQINKALEVGKTAFEYSKELGFPDQTRDVSLLLSNIYEDLDRHEESLEMYKLSIRMRDSLINEKNKKAVYREQLNYEFERKENERKLEAQKKELLVAQEKKRQNMIILFISVGMVLSIIFLLFVYNRFRLIKKQKKLIEMQKKLVDDQRGKLEEKNNQITDSISYAKKIQKAVLPSKNELASHFTDSFVFYKPKDMVSGDFHWFHKSGDTIIFTVADCTGHGVPGAFMSIIGNNLLDKIVSGYNITQPDLILNKLNLELYNRMNKGKSSELGDGMDIAICSINLTTKKLRFSGAHNPLYLIRNKELTQFKGDRLHIGNLENTKGKSFTLHEVDLMENDALYLFSDGYADQKGGEKGKKFYLGAFRQLLIENSSNPMEKQKSILTSTIVDWRGEREQIDDMLIMGIRI